MQSFDLVQIDFELELIALADKMPMALQDIAHSQEALQFYRKATRIAKTPRDWSTLSQRLDEIVKEDRASKKRGAG